MKSYPTLRSLIAAAALASLASAGFAQDSLYDTPPTDSSLDTSPGAQDVQPYQIAPSMSDTDTMNQQRQLGPQGPIRNDSAENNTFAQSQGRFSGGTASERGFAAFLQYQANSTNSP